MLINLTNHPSSTWSKEQIQAAEKYGGVTDWPFPPVAPEWDEKQIESLAQTTASEILQRFPQQDLTIHLMGEFTLTMSLLRIFQRKNIPCVASTTERQVKERGEGQREVFFRFVRFRTYSTQPD